MWNIINVTGNFISNVISNVFNVISDIGCVINPVGLFEWLIICDGICGSINFAGYYIKYGRKFWSGSDVSVRRNIVKRYSELYSMGYMDRCIFYLFLYISNIFIVGILGNGVVYKMYILCTICTIPIIQNGICKIKFLDDIIREFGEDKRRFFKYTISKVAIRGMKELDDSIGGIKNYHIFIMYKYISFEFLFNFIKCYIFIYSLYFLRNSVATYYYYKAIKMAYYYNTGYLFNIITKQDAINRINLIIQTKKWKELANIENVHSLYVLIKHKWGESNNTLDTYFLYIIGVFTLWNFISLIKIINYIITGCICLIYVLWCICKNKMYLRQNYGDVFLGILVYTMIFLNINDLVITITSVNYKMIYIIFNEVLFYIKNKGDIKKILKFYKLKTN